MNMTNIDVMKNGQRRSLYEPLARKFVEVYYERLVNYAKRLVTHENVDDLVQTVVMCVLSGEYNIRFDQYPLTYVYKIMKRESTRGAHATQVLHTPIKHDQDYSNYTTVISIDQLGELYRKNIIPNTPRHRLIVKCIQEGYTVKEIGGVLGVSPQRVSVLLKIMATKAGGSV